MRQSVPSIVLGFMLAVAGTAGAADNAPYPSRPVKLVVPFAPGGFTDLTARILGQKLSEAMGQQFVIENKPGAGSTISSV